MICGEKGVFDVGWLPEDVLLLSVLINLYDERQGGEELLTAPLFFSWSLNSSNTERETGLHTPKQKDKTELYKYIHICKN